MCLISSVLTAQQVALSPEEEDEEEDDEDDENANADKRSLPSSSPTKHVCVISTRPSASSILVTVLTKSYSPIANTEPVSSQMKILDLIPTLTSAPSVAMSSIDPPSSNTAQSVK